MTIEIKYKMPNSTLLRKAMEEGDGELEGVKFHLIMYRMGISERKALIYICDPKTGAFICDGEKEGSLLPELLKEGFPYLEIFLSKFTGEDIWEIMKNKIHHDELEEDVSILTFLLYFDDREHEPEHYTEVFVFLLQHLTPQQRMTLLFTKDVIEGQEVTPFGLIVEKRDYLLPIIFAPNYLIINTAVTSDLTTNTVTEEDLLSHIEFLDFQILIMAKLAKVATLEPLVERLSQTLRTLIENRTKVQEALLQLRNVQASSSALLNSGSLENKRQASEIAGPPTSSSSGLRKRKYVQTLAPTDNEKFAQAWSAAARENKLPPTKLEVKRNLMGLPTQPPASSLQPILPEEKITPSIPIDSAPDQEILESTWFAATSEGASSIIETTFAQPLPADFQIFPETKSVGDSKTSVATLSGTPMEIEVAGQAGLTTTPRERVGNIMLLARSMAKLLSLTGSACQTAPLSAFASEELPVVPESSFLIQSTHGLSESKGQQPESLNTTNTTEEDFPMRFSKL